MGSVHAGFDEILDRCVTAMQADGKTVEDCLAAGTRAAAGEPVDPAERQQLGELLTLAARLQQGRSLAAPARFRAESARRMRSLPSRPAARPSRLTRPRLRPAYFWAVVVALVLALSGVTAASAQSLPGDWLYGAKMAVETLQLALTRAGLHEGELRIAFAGRRLAEVATLVTGPAASPGGPVPRGWTPDAEQALTGYSLQVNDALALLDDPAGLPVDDQASLALLLVSQLDRHEAQLAGLLSRVPANSRPSIEAALSLSRAGRRKALEIIRDHPGGLDDLPFQVPEGLRETATRLSDEPRQQLPDPDRPTVLATPTPDAPPPTARPTLTPTPGAGAGGPRVTGPAGEDGWPPFTTAWAGWETAQPTGWITQCPPNPTRTPLFLQTPRPTRPTARPTRPPDRPTRPAPWPPDWRED